MSVDFAGDGAKRTGLKRRRIVVDDTPLAQRIGGRIRRARLAAGLTQQQLANGRYTKAYISALETGQSKPSMAALNFIAERLGMVASRFLDDEPATWSRLAVDLELAAGRWQAALDGYQSLLDSRPSVDERAEVLRGLAEAHAAMDHGAAAAAAAAESAKLFGALGRSADAALARYWLAAGEYLLGNTPEAVSILQSILEQVRSGLRVDPDFELRLVMALATAASSDGRHEIALAYLEEVRGLAETLDDARRATYLHELSRSYLEAGDYEAAVRAGVSSLALFRASASQVGLARLENDLALSFLALGNGTRADELASSAQAALERLGDRRALANVYETRAQIASTRGDKGAARDLASAAVNLAEETGNDRALVSALLSLARATRSLGDPSTAAGLYERAVELARRSSRPGLIREAMGEWADVLSETGQHERAATLLREALRAV